MGLNLVPVPQRKRLLIKLEEFYLKPFYLYKRAGDIYYAQFHDPITHRRCAVRSMETTNKEEALAKAWAMFATLPKKQQHVSEITNIINLLNQKNYKLEELAMLQAVIQAKCPELRPTVSVQTVTASPVADTPDTYVPTLTKKTRFSRSPRNLRCN